MKKKYRYLKGNKHAQKTFPRDGQLSCRFNKRLKEMAAAHADTMPETLADYVERLIVADLRNAGKMPMPPP